MNVVQDGPCLVELALRQVQHVRLHLGLLQVLFKSAFLVEPWKFE
jgi:hypothetical protein